MGTIVSDFRDERAAKEFWLLSVATFLCFTTHQQSSLLAVVMESHGMALPRIGIVLSAFSAAVVACSLAAGPIASRLGNLATLQLSFGLLLAGYASFQLTIDHFGAAVLSRLVQGIGYALFMPTAMALARSKLGAGRLIYLFGMFSSMVTLPNAVAPPLGEAYLNAFGDSWFFIISAVPLAMALALSAGLTDEPPMPESGTRLLPLRTAMRPGLRRPLLAILVVGVLYGLTLSYMAPLLVAKGVSIGFYFTSFTILLFASRFVLMRFLPTWPHMALVALGIGAMATAYFLLVFAHGPLTVAIAGIFFGLGYSVAFPTISIAISEQFEPHQRTSCLAVFNTVFSLGMLLTPWLGTYVISALDYAGLLWVLAACGFASLPYLLWPLRRSAERAHASKPARTTEIG